MSDNWDFYFCPIGDAPASFFVDLDAARPAPPAGFEQLGYVRLHLRAPQEDGLSSRGEFDTLVAVEEALEAGLVDADCRYVGRVTCAGCRDFYFYRREEAGWQDRVRAVLAAFPEYAYESGGRHEPDWETYTDYLEPDELQRQSIENRRVLGQLEARGDDGRRPREVDHWIYFERPEQRRAFVEAAVALGYAVRALHAPDSPGGRWCAQLWRVDVLAGRAADEATLPLFQLAQRHQGKYDGWECPVCV